MSNQLNHGFKRRERPPTPIDGNVGKESILFYLTSGRRQVANSNGQAGLVGQVLHLLLRQPIARAIGAPTISHDQQFLDFWARVCYPRSSTTV